MTRKGRWWRGLDSNQCTLSGQIYSLMDLTTLPPLHYNVAWVGNEAPGRVVGAVYGGLMTQCQHPFGNAPQEKVNPGPSCPRRLV